MRAAWPTRSSGAPPPSSTRWSARRRRSRTSATVAATRAISATAAAMSATTPVVDPRSTAARVTGPPGGRRTARRAAAAPRAAGRGGSAGEPAPPRRRSPLRREQRRVRLRVVVGLLLARHRRDRDLDRDGPAGGRRGVQRDRDRRLRAGLGLVDRLGHRDRLAGAGDLHGHLDVLLVVVALVGERDVERAALRCGDAVDDLAGLERDAAGADADEPVAVQAGRHDAARRGRAVRRGGVQLLRDLPGVEPAEARQELGLRDALARDAVVVQRLLDQRRDPLRVRDVGREERLHLAGDAAQRVLRAGLRAQRRRQQVRDPRDAVRAEVEDLLEVAVRGLHVAGHAEVLRALDVLLGDQAHLVDRDLEVVRRAAALEHVEQLTRDLVVGALDDRRDLAVVVLERAVVTVVEAAVDADDQQDQDDRQAAEQQRLAPAREVRRWAARRRGGATGGRGPPPPGGAGDAGGVVRVLVRGEGNVPSPSGVGA